MDRNIAIDIMCKGCYNGCTPYNDQDIMDTNSESEEEDI